ncbi:hypothetical protein [Oceanisphaera arctica]|uniref:hypothetical protein n=1 Tax=Oceanisphaera arctica TaxID=641510 RepID=UPI0015E325D1|nr:hypothetical protein [Oceanisphaera arctica]
MLPLVWGPQYDQIITGIGISQTIVVEDTAQATKKPHFCGFLSKTAQSRRFTQMASIM